MERLESTHEEIEFGTLDSPYPRNIARKVNADFALQDWWLRHLAQARGLFLFTSVVVGVSAWLFLDGVVTDPRILLVAALGPLIALLAEWSHRRKPDKEPELSPEVNDRLKELGFKDPKLRLVATGNEGCQVRMFSPDLVFAEGYFSNLTLDEKVAVSAVAIRLRSLREILRIVVLLNPLFGLAMRVVMPGNQILARNEVRTLFLGFTVGFAILLPFLYMWSSRRFLAKHGLLESYDRARRIRLFILQQIPWYVRPLDVLLSRRNSRYINEFKRAKFLD